jgi:hypothetical protein
MVLLWIFLNCCGNSNHDVRGPFYHFGHFLSLLALMVKFTRLIDTVLSPEAVSSYNEIMRICNSND